MAMKDSHFSLEMSSTSSSNFDSNPIIDEGDYYTHVNGYRVPQNIHHRFRSSITSQLLADRDKVERDRQEFDGARVRPAVPVYRRSQPLISNPDYTTMSNNLRSAVCYGHPVERRSHTKTVHSDEVFNRRGANTFDSAHRRTKDWLGRWTEANIIRDRLYKDTLATPKKKSST